MPSQVYIIHILIVILAFAFSLVQNGDDGIASSPELQCHEVWLTPIQRNLPDDSVVLDLVRLRIYGEDQERHISMSAPQEDFVYRFENILNENSTSLSRIGRTIGDPEGSEPWLRFHTADFVSMDMIQIMFADNAHTLRNILNYRLSVIAWPHRLRHQCHHIDHWIVQDGELVSNMINHEGSLESMTALVMDAIEGYVMQRSRGVEIGSIADDQFNVLWSVPLSELQLVVTSDTGEVTTNPPLMLQLSRVKKFEEGSTTYGGPDQYEIDSVCDYLKYSHNGQDLRVVQYFQGKRDGVYIDIGASDGVAHSNTYMLERYFHWSGLVVEAMAMHRESLWWYRFNSQILAPFCVYNRSFYADFVQGINDNEELSGVLESWPWAGHEQEGYRKAEDYRTVKVPCFAINEVLQAHGYFHVDYLSVDIEGADLVVLQSIDWDRFSATIVSVECHEHFHKEICNELRALFMHRLKYASWERVGWDLMFFKE